MSLPKNRISAFFQNHSRIKLHKSTSNFKSHPRNFPDITHSVSNKENMPSKKRNTRFRFTDASRPADPPHISPRSSRTTNQPLNSPCATRTANPSPPQTPTSPAASSNINTPLTPSPQIATFDNIVNKIQFSKSLKAAPTSKNAVLK